MRLQPPFPPFFLRGLGRCRRRGDGGGSRCGPGGVPRPSAFAAAGRLCRRGRSRVGGVFRRCGGGGFVPGGFRGVAGALLRGLPARRVGGAGGGFPAGSMGVPGAGRVPRLRRGRDGREVAPASGCAGFCADCGVFAALRAAFCSVLRAGRCAGCCPASASRAGRCADLAPAFRAGFGSWVRAGRCAAFCAGFRAGAALRRAYSGTGPSVGIVSPVSFWMSQRYSNSSSEQNDHAAPSCPARPVRPMRWT